MQDQLLDMLMKEDEITWQTILMDLIRSEEMDPWDVDVSILANKYIGIVKKLKEANLGISGKVLLASALLLKVKTNKLVDEDLLNLDRMIAGEDDEDDFDEDWEEGQRRLVPLDIPKNILLPRVPQPRKRKVSVYDLMDALQKALNVTKRRKVRDIIDSVAVKIPIKKVDIAVLIDEVYEKVRDYYGGEFDLRLKFSQLVPSDAKEDVVYTLQPLLHLSNAKKVGLKQPIHFGDIDVTMIDEENPDMEFVKQYEEEQEKIKDSKRKKSPKKASKRKKSEEVQEEAKEESPQDPSAYTPALTNDPEALQNMQIMNAQETTEVYDGPMKLSLDDLKD